MPLVVRAVASQTSFRGGSRPVPSLPSRSCLGTLSCMPYIHSTVHNRSPSCLSGPAVHQLSLDAHHHMPYTWYPACQLSYCVARWGGEFGVCTRFVRTTVKWPDSCRIRLPSPSVYRPYLLSWYLASIMSFPFRYLWCRKDLIVHYSVVVFVLRVFTSSLCV